MYNTSVPPVVAALSLLALSAGLVCGQSQTNAMVRVLEVKASDALKTQAEKNELAAKLMSIVESLENNINQGVDDSHKFTTLTRHLKSTVQEQALSGNEPLLGAQYILETTVTRFEYDRTNIPIVETGQVAAQCTIRLSGRAEFKKPNGPTSSANFEVSTNFSEAAA